MLAHEQKELDVNYFKCKLLIMTSGNNHDETMSFFSENNYFGAKAHQIIFFMQSSLPALDTSGKIIMRSQYETQLSPNGNGALFEAINSNKYIKQIIQSTQHVQVIGVDNVLNKILDPIQVGYNAVCGLEASLKVCVKRDPSEKVGVVCIKDGKYDIVEYSELDPAQAEKKREGDDSRFELELGSILIFMLSSRKLLSLCASSA